MSARKVAGVLCLALAGFMLVANVGVLFPGPGEAERNTSRVIGVFLIPLVLVIVALKLFQKPKSGS
jgi:hypothetical protein